MAPGIDIITQTKDHTINVNLIPRAFYRLSEVAVAMICALSTCAGRPAEKQRIKKKNKKIKKKPTRVYRSNPE
jgi:hypothetical protein